MNRSTQLSFSNKGSYLTEHWWYFSDRINVPNTLDKHSDNDHVFGMTHAIHGKAQIAQTVCVFLNDCWGIEPQWAIPDLKSKQTNKQTPQQTNKQTKTYNSL